MNQNIEALAKAPTMIQNGGRWAGERLMQAAVEGKELSPNLLRTGTVLRKEEWSFFDTALVEEGVIRLKAVADIIAAGNVINIPNAMGITNYEYEKISDMNAPDLSMDGNARTENDAVTFSPHNLPLPIMHKDFFMSLRKLTASRNKGESLDTTQIRLAGRLIGEETEKLLFQGTSKIYGAVPIYGYLTHPDRNVGAYSGTIAWSNASKTGAQMLTDLQTMIALLEADRFYGPYNVYVPTTSSVHFEDDFKAASDKTIIQRLLEMQQINSITVCDQCTVDKIVMVQMGMETAAMVQGIPLQTVQWDINGGFTLHFKAFQISIPLIRSDKENRCGVANLSL
jgi:uncharacterized linocin/CFP29 family protein